MLAFLAVGLVGLFASYRALRSGRVISFLEWFGPKIRTREKDGNHFRAAVAHHFFAWGVWTALMIFGLWMLVRGLLYEARIHAT